MSLPRSDGVPSLQLISFPICPYVHRATTMLREKGVEHEITYVDLADKPDWFLALSPRGKVPVLVTEGTPLFESVAILEFLDETRAPRFMPEDPVERARHRAWVEVTGDLLSGQYRAALAPTQPELDKTVAAIRRTLELFEGVVRLPLFAGERFSMVDAAAGPALFRLLVLEERSPLRFFQGMPRARTWADRLASRPSVTEGVRPTFADEYIEFARSPGGALSRQLTRGT